MTTKTTNQVWACKYFRVLAATNPGSGIVRKQPDTFSGNMCPSQIVSLYYYLIINQNTCKAYTYQWNSKFDSQKERWKYAPNLWKKHMLKNLWPNQGKWYMEIKV
jgi:hypothetical protein